ncbi:MAG: DUF3795 domain-containing protein [Bacteroidetes bacterium]|nr:DUF3795 domain-containing protein [Bacteroidota bacterium]MBT7465559.1 DUF3795 domain-containing protein [Bacteroidota bacterium]
MDYELIKKRLAPCGLHCGKCFAFKDGDIGKFSFKLRESLGDFDVYAKRFVDLIDEPVFLKYPEFKEMLDYMSLPQCGGCREEKCKLFKGCKVRECSERLNVDYCFECIDFPCNNTGFDEHLQKRSVEINTRMKEIGVDNYYDEIKDKSRY